MIQAVIVDVDKYAIYAFNRRLDRAAGIARRHAFNTKPQERA
jgi:hypothetical protein